MIWIQKGKEPLSLTAYKKKMFASYDGYSDKNQLREALLRDQGYICAYCMRRIKNDEKTMKIEHWKAQSQLKTEEEKLDFRIMLGVCDGCRGSKDKYTTCDEHRHDAALYVNPLDQEMMKTITYDRNGYIHSKISEIDRDLNDILNLNCEQAPSRIVLNRKMKYEECKRQLIKIQKEGNWKPATLRQVQHFYEKRTDGQNPEYVGVVQYLLNKYMEKQK